MSYIDDEIKAVSQKSEEIFNNCIMDIKKTSITVTLNQYISVLQVSKISNSPVNTDFEEAFKVIKSISDDNNIKLKKIDVDYLGYKNAKKALKHLNLSKIDETVILFETIRDYLVENIK